ncbi:ABC transporter ATP-binding protein [Celerinatantimonas sp. MCCC 1A17872]|uniref:ABC transporter ATP-binding protein n=1 Tax=Celerinatantimonas sp. MCCC 1A17872 TaxID=3177514 RepID=UPI0038C034A3
MSQLQLQQVTKRYAEQPIIENLSLEIENGEFLVLVGASGCGKSTLLRMIAGLEEVSSGHIYCDQTDITARSPRERNFSMIFQNYALFPHMSVEKNITFGMKVRGEKLKENQLLIDKTVSMLQLDELLKRRPKELSGGQRQRVAMARAIVRNPQLFLMDEPLSNLDAKLRHDVRDGIMAMHEQLKVTTIYVTHDQVEAMTMADRIVVLDKGQIQQIGTPEQLYQSPNNLFVARFIGSPSMNTWQVPIHNGALHFANWQIPVRENHDSLWLGLRPEHIHLGESRDGQNQFNARFERQELLGHVRLLTLRADFGTVQLFCDNEASLPDIGQSLSCHFQAQRVHLFCAKTYQRLLIKDL